MNFKPIETDENVLVMPGAVVCGDVTVGEGTAFWFNSVCRAELQPIKIGKRCNIQDCAVIHNLCTLGDDVSVGHGAIVHGATVGDRVIVVGEAPAVHNVEKVLGNAEKNLNEPNIAAIFIGIILGLAVGAVPLHLPGISAPVRLGLAGGPIIVGILIGTFGPRLHMITYTTLSANLMLRGIGLSMYLACLGLDAGAHFFDTVMRPEGAMWIGLGFALTLLPVLVMGWIALRWSRLDFGSTCGMLCGAMANPMALGYANDTIEGDNPSVSYATVYPLSMFVRVILAQVVLLFFR